MLSIATSISDANAMGGEKQSKSRRKSEITIDERRYSLITPAATKQTKELYYRLSTMKW